LMIIFIPSAPNTTSLLQEFLQLQNMLLLYTNIQAWIYMAANIY
jgi:hypothetical protein